MTDVEASTPGKRKSLSNKQGRKDSAKKFAPDTKSPQKTNVFNKGVTPKKQKGSPNKQNSSQKPNKKNRGISESDSPKKLKPFAGTAEIQTPGEEKKNKKVKNENAAEKEERKQRRKGQFHHLALKVKSGEKEVIATLAEKIKAIEGRGELTKTAKRKLKFLMRLKNVAEGKPREVQQVKSPNSKSASAKRHDRKKKAILNANEQVGLTAKGNDAKTNGKANQKGKPQNKQLAKKPKLEAKQDDSDDELEEDEVEGDSEAEEEEDQESGSENGEEEDEESADEVEGEDSDEVEGEDSDEVEGEESDEEDEESEEETPPQEEESNSEDTVPKKKIKRAKTENETKNKPVNLDELKKNNLVGKNQKRFVLFVGNIPYDTNKLDLIEHFKKCGEIKHIRIPTEKKSSKPRGFAYVEVGSEETYQKCLSMHHSFLKSRRINVLYTQGGKKKGEEKKKEIKAKNFKLHAMRKQGMLVGSKKETQKRSFRRAKQRIANSEQESHD